MTEARSPSAGVAEAAAGIPPIATLPVFLKLHRRRALIAGGTLPAVWKAELVAAAGAHVIVAADDPCPEMAALAARSGGSITLAHRAWHPGDLRAAAVAIGALRGEHAEAFHRAAREAGVPVNVIDVPALCDFQFGTIVARSPLVIGISTDGAAPVFGQALRARIEGLLPGSIGRWAQAAKEWRSSLQSRDLSFAARRRFWETFADRALGAADRGPGEADQEACLAAAFAAGQTRAGRLVLVGVGPGEADLVTLRAVRVLQSAEVILYDTDVPAAILGLARREAVRRTAPRSIGHAAKEAVSQVQQGKTVVWAALGDGESCRSWQLRRLALATEEIPLEVVNGLKCRDCLGECRLTIGDPETS